MADAVWATPINQQDAALRLTVAVPGDWTIERTLEWPMQCIAPASGEPPFCVCIQIGTQVAPPLGAGLLPFAADAFFSMHTDPDQRDFFATDPQTVQVAGAPALLQNSSWVQGSAETEVTIRQIVVVTQMADRLYIFRMLTNPELTDAAIAAFQALLQSVRYDQPPADPVPPVEPARGGSDNAANANAKPAGRWRTPKSVAAESEHSL